MSTETNYHTFIGDEAQIREFYRLHILPYKEIPYTNFIIIPIARRKYWTPLATSQENMSTKIFSPSDGEDRFVNELKRYEVRCGLYVDSKGQMIPSEAMAFYLTVNTMNELKAYFLMQQEVSKKLEILLLSKGDRGEKNEDKGNKLGHISSIFKSCLHKSDNKEFLKLDVDTKDADKIESLKTFLKEHSIEPHLVVETRGGYHVLLKKSMIGKHHEKLFRYVNETSEKGSWITIEKNALVAIPGTFQGGFLVKLFKF